jgi:hypothetical protein
VNNARVAACRNVTVNNWIRKGRMRAQKGGTTHFS